MQRQGGTNCYRSKTQSNFALPSGGADLNSAVKGGSEATGVFNELREPFSENQGVILKMVAGACKEMLPRPVLGEVHHFGTQQVGVQVTIRCCRSAESAMRQKDL